MNDPRFMSKGYITIGSNKFAVSLAISEQEQTNGLMYIDPPLTSMAFVYSVPQINRFWMKDVKADLDVLFCYKGRIVDIVEAEAMSTRLLGDGQQYTDLVLEFPTQITDKYKFKVGQDVKLNLSKEAVAKIFE